MGLIDRLLRRVPQQRAIDWDDVSWGARVVESGGGSPDRALRLIPVYGAVGLIADSVAGLPLQVYQEAGAARARVATPPWLVKPDYRIIRFAWVHQALSSLLLRGNAYGLLLRDAVGQIVGLVWLPPTRVVVDESGPTPVYRIGGKEYVGYYAGGDIVHIPAFTVPGTVVGLSPVGLFRRQFSVLEHATEFEDEWFDGRAIPSGILKNSEATFTAEQTRIAKAQFKASMRTGEPIVLDKNWSWEQLSLSPGDAQFLEAIKASATQIAVIFRVDPEDVGGVSGNSLKYSTVEGNQRKYNNRTLLAWTTRIEEALSDVLPVGQFARFNLDALARPNLLERARATTEQLKNGTLTNPEARALEDRPALTPAEVAFWHDHYLTPSSSGDVASAIASELRPPED